MTEVISRGRKVEVIGKVISDKMDKTISIITYRMIRHKKYGKFVKKSSVLKAHDEKEIAKVGDKVRIVETKPISKSKRWKLTEVIETSKEWG